VPLTVGSFVGLAAGTQTFVDEKNGVVTTRPYYNGLKCHRIIKDFMIQGGCPRGNGTSGPGYEFPDEFDSTLRHTTAGMLSMANSGADTNGSQFFVTVAPTTHLDNKHNVFGQVVDGYDTVVEPLSLVPTVDPANNDDRPILPVIIEELTIHRAGSAARSFAPPLPVVDLIPLTPSRGAGNTCMLDFARTPFAGSVLLHTGDLRTWEMEELGNFGASPQTDLLSGTSFAPPGSPKRYFRMARVNYPSPGPASLTGKRIVVESSNLRVTYNLSTDTTGTYNVFQTPSTNINGNILSWTWTRNSWGGELSANIPAGDITIGTDQIRFLDAELRPATNLARGALYLQNHNTYYNLPGVSRLTITNLP
jgi:cyclophilin family peptidyl-prolyl cis-trans isomerase